MNCFIPTSLHSLLESRGHFPQFFFTPSVQVQKNNFYTYNIFSDIHCKIFSYEISRLWFLRNVYFWELGKNNEKLNTWIYRGRAGDSTMNISIYVYSGAQVVCNIYSERLWSYSELRSVPSTIFVINYILIFIYLSLDSLIACILFGKYKFVFPKICLWILKLYVYC